MEIAISTAAIFCADGYSYRIRSELRQGLAEIGINEPRIIRHGLLLRFQALFRSEAEVIAFKMRWPEFVL